MMEECQYGRSKSCLPSHSPKEYDAEQVFMRPNRASTVGSYFATAKKNSTKNISNRLSDSFINFLKKEKQTNEKATQVTFSLEDNLFEREKAKEESKKKKIESESRKEETKKHEKKLKETSPCFLEFEWFSMLVVLPVMFFFFHFFTLFFNFFLRTVFIRGRRVKKK